MKQSDAGRILLVLIGATCCTTMFLVLRCNIDDQDVLTLARSQPVAKDFMDQEHSLLSGNATEVLRTNGSRILQMIYRTKVHNVTSSDNVNQFADIFSIGQRAAKSLVEPVSYNNEFEVVPFTRFELDRIYPVDPGLGRRVIEKPIGYRKHEIQNAIEHGINSLTQQTGRKFSVSDFLEGIYRVVPSIGTQYELYFRDNTQYHKVIIVLPNLLPFVIGDETIPVQKDTVHVVVALSQRVDSFQKFLQRFRKLVIQDNNVDLTVVYFGRIGLKKVQLLVRNFNTDLNSDKVHLLTTSDKFSRGHGLKIGADSLQNNSLLFMCDVDIVFTGSFLERCRLHTSLGQSVYYPIVFSLYNPSVIAQLHHTTNTTSSSEKPVISRDAGFWRDFGYGMTCQYRADFLQVGGFRDETASNESVAGWGLEDVRLYRKHLQSSRVNVIRATDTGIFHIWHEKTCLRSLPRDQYEGCLRSRALSEASHAQLGMLLLRHNSHTLPRTVSEIPTL